MTWKCNEQPTDVWDQDIWERGSDGKFFVAHISKQIWLARDGETIPFSNQVKSYQENRIL